MSEAMVTVLMACSWDVIRAEVIVLPVIQPNDYLFEHHADKGEEKWEIYAWACRDIMAKVGGFAKHDINFKTKEMAFKWYAGKSDTYIYEGDPESTKHSRDSEVTPTKTPEKENEPAKTPTPTEAKTLFTESEEPLRGKE